MSNSLCDVIFVLSLIVALLNWFKALELQNKIEDKSTLDITTSELVNITSNIYFSVK